jgi:formaldehyde-activating enzyme involved in methanogenesis
VVVEAVGVVSSSKDKALSKKIEAAMAQAVASCLEAGITDPKVIRDAQLAARAHVKG